MFYSCSCCVFAISNEGSSVGFCRVCDSIGVGYERAHLMSYLLFIRPPLETRKIHIHTVLFPEPKVRQRKLKCPKILSKTPRENYFLREVARVCKHFICIGHI